MFVINVIFFSCGFNYYFMINKCYNLQTQTRLQFVSFFLNKNNKVNTLCL